MSDSISIEQKAHDVACALLGNSYYVESYMNIRIEELVKEMPAPEGEINIHMDFDIYGMYEMAYNHALKMFKKE